MGLRFAARVLAAGLIGAAVVNFALIFILLFPNAVVRTEAEVVVAKLAGGVDYQLWVAQDTPVRKHLMAGAAVEPGVGLTHGPGNQNASLTINDRRFDAFATLSAGTAGEYEVRLPSPVSDSEVRVTRWFSAWDFILRIGVVLACVLGGVGLLVASRRR